MITNRSQLTSMASKEYFVSTGSETAEGGEQVTWDPTSVPLLLNPDFTKNDELRKFRISLRWCALDQSSIAGRAISYLTFIIFTLVVPAAIALFVQVPSVCGDAPFNKLVQLPESGLALISFLTLCTFFQRYGLRQLLFLDDLIEDSDAVCQGYTSKLEKSFRNLTYILFPSFSVELAHKIIFFSIVSMVPQLPGIQVMWDFLAFVVTVISWVYRTVVFLFVCVLFRLTCELQILRFEGFYKIFDDHKSNVEHIYKEHMRIKRQCLITSHRYRVFIISCLVTITISQLGALFLVLGSKSPKNFCNAGDIVVCSAVQLSGFLMCLMGAARITHRAQRVVCIASRWHMMLTANKDGSQVPHKLPPCQEEIPSSYESRQALVMYLQHNKGGITIFGFSLDRGLLHAIFVFEMTLVLWILSKVVFVS